MAAPVGPRWWRILGWSCYLACSWTWCIGMFLPVLLLRDFGPWSFVVFAVPNVAGAAAMGWVLRKPGAAASLRERHRGMVDLFTGVTIAFHVVTFMWFATSMEKDSSVSDWVGLSFVAPFIVLLPVLISRRVQVQHVVSLATWIASLVLLAGIGWSGQLKIPVAPGHLPTSHLVWLSSVCVFGFALCPYLDRTFLWAADRLGPRESPIAFGLGFAVFFLTMITGTLLYAGMFDVGPGLQLFAKVGSVPVGLFLAHFLLQLLFTSRVHGVAWDPPKASESSASMVGAICGLTIIGVRVLLLKTEGFSHASLSLGEILYRSFMVFYGLVFPAYVWLCMIPNWSSGRPTRRQRGVWLGACTLAAPMYWMGFIERETWWLAPGVGLVLLARVLVPMRPEGDRGAERGMPPPRAV
jgi:hypothetical protein